MRFSAILSALFHTAIIVAAMTSFANPRRFDAELPSSIPVELLTLAEATNVSAAIAETEDEPEPIEEEVVEEAPPEPEPVRQVASLPDPVLTLPAEEPEFSPFEEPDPVPVEAEADPAPVPAPDLGDVRPTLRPRPPERRQGFDFAAAAATIDLTPQEENPVFDLDNLQIGDDAQLETAEEARSRVGLGTEMTISEIDFLRAQIYPCWNPPVGARDAADLQIELRVHFNSDNTVLRVDTIDQVRYNTESFYRAAVDSAKRAVWRCQSGPRPDGTYRQVYDLPQDRTWQTMGMTFNPRNLF